MTILPASISRVSNLMSSGLLLSNLNRTNLGLLDLQTQMTTGKAINRPSDDSVKASAIAALMDRLSRADQRSRNLTQADSVLSTLDNSLGDASDLVKQAQSIASGQIGITSDPQTRQTESVVIDSLIRQLTEISNRNVSGMYIFGGSTPSQPPITQIASGYRYTAKGSGLLTDLGSGDQIPITIGGNNAIGETSARQRSTTVLSPNLTGATRVSDLNGARGLGVSLGTVNMQFNAGPVVAVDLTGAANINDIASKLTAAIKQYETSNGVTILQPPSGQVTTNGSSLQFDLDPSVTGPGLAISDITGGTTAADLGISSAFIASSEVGTGIGPKLTLQTPLSSIPGVTTPLGTIRLHQARGAAQTIRDVDLSGAQTIDDVRNLIESAGVGVRVQINDAGTGIDISNELAGMSLSVESTGGVPDSATQLGIRTLMDSTPLSDFNHGKGVRIVDGSTDPITGLPDPTRDVDFTVNFGLGGSFAVNLKPADLANFGTLRAAINSAAAAAGYTPAQFTAIPVTGTNGLTFQTDGTFGAIGLTQNNNSPALDDLGLKNGAYNAGTKQFVAQDRASIRVDNLFSDLIDLRDALLNNDTPGITLATEHLNSSADRLIQANALVGTYGQRVTQLQSQIEDQKVADTKLQSDLQDTDFAAAASKFSLLQTQLQATLQVGGQFQSRSLLDFLP